MTQSLQTLPLAADADISRARRLGLAWALAGGLDAAAAAAAGIACGQLAAAARAGGAAPATLVFELLDGAPPVLRCWLKGGTAEPAAVDLPLRERPGTLAPLDEQSLQAAWHAMAQRLRTREHELDRLNEELVDTNRGVVALYAELDDHAERLRNADAAKSRFLHNVSHEFKTPLASIRALSALLMSGADGELSLEQTKQVRLIREAVDGMIEMVGDLLDIARIEAGKAQVKLAPVAVEELFSGLRGMFKPMVKPEVRLAFDDGGHRLVTDEGKLTQILRNLLSNALKFTPAGSVQLSCRAEPGQQLAFEVADTGIGIAPEHQPMIFEEFVQVENPLQAAAQGTGLGLPLCRQLAQLLGGDLSLSSELGAGCVFTLRLPQRHPLADEAGSSDLTAGEAQAS